MKKIKIIYGLEAVGGGALKHLTYLVTRLDKDRFDITVILSNLRQDNSQADIDQLIASGANIVHLPIKQRLHILSDLKMLFQIINILRKGKYDIIHAHSSKAGGLFRIAAFVLGKKNVLYTPHCFYFMGLSGLKKMVFLFLEKLLSKLTTYIIVSEGEKKEALKHHVAHEKRIQNINNAIDFNEYQQPYEISETLKEFSIPQGRFIVGAIGRLSPQKDWETFIFAAKEVLKKDPEVIFVIAGEGELKNEIEKLIFKLDLEKSILLTGFVQEVHKFFGIIDVFVNTSLWEGLPYAILEAMQYKKPIIATDTGNEDVIVHDKSGFITPVKDYQAIAKKIFELIGDKQKAIKMGKVGNEILTKKYSFELFIKNHESLYEQMLQ